MREIPVSHFLVGYIAQGMLLVILLPIYDRIVTAPRLPPQASGLRYTHLVRPTQPFDQ
ncbi:hypothetical protein L226DRAFT_535311 [Lentinus tigrinus ALCF2SS1-7]|uniref:Uncharacterized protein n=1 Tax=Lentinus tigrinus ALCF2SS1-6 TaxID=1328759 RepID=A0A5C2SKF9_9APHY|nr:hypothetical protein L227DRAFT_573808 [Lentinus tigrinus ALCF2SS1-6]RPD74433.1 hypothetical protein L226DRAFT_535311 [Lentinus tigrinus ALCF2SS1-7]